MKNYEIIGSLGQWLSLGLTTVGLLLMIGRHAPEWHDFVTSGALVLTVATKVRYYGGNIIINRKRKRLISISDIIDSDNNKNASKKESYNQEAQNG